MTSNAGVVGNDQCIKGRSRFLRSPDNSTAYRWSPVSRTIRKIPNEARPQNRNLAGATVNAPGAELANSSHSHECLVGSHLQAPNQHGTAGKGSSGALSFSDLMPGNQSLDFDDDGDSAAGTVLGRKKVVISAQSGQGLHKVTKVEGIPAKHSPGELLKKMKAKSVFSCGGHVAKDKESGREFLVIQGNVSAAVAAFLMQQGVADGDSIVRRGRE